MHCPNCQNDLIEIPTLEGPQLDVCPREHGLWMDKGEATLFVKNYRTLGEALHGGATEEVITTSGTTCPKCGGQLDQESVLATALFACRVCHGWWLPRGSLTQLNATTRGGDIKISVDETEFYRRAEKRASRSPTTEVLYARSRNGPRTPHVWFWTLFLSAALFLALSLVVAGMRKIVAPGQWEIPPDTTWVLLILGTLAGMGLCAYGFVLDSRRRLIESLPTSTVRSLAIGPVEVTGRAQPERALLRAPFSGMPCVLFSYTVEERRTSGKESRWETIATGMSQEPFYVQDNTGRVLVVPFDAKLILPDNRTTRSNWSGSLPEEAILGLLKLGIAVDGWFGEKTIRCHEAFILPDEQIYVMGTAQEHRGAEERADNSGRLYIGSHRDNAFIISDRSEKELLSSLRWQVWVMVGGGPTLALFCLLLLFLLYRTGQ